MSESTTIVAESPNAAKYWKACSILLGIGFVLAIMSHAGPAQTKASVQLPPAWLESQADVSTTQYLAIGGFDKVDNEIFFVLVNEHGQRVGLMAMPEKSSE